MATPPDRINGTIVSRTPRTGGPHGNNDAEIKYKALFEQSPYGIVIIDTRGTILDSNETAHRDLGYTREEFANLSIADIDPFESAAETQARIGRILSSGGAEFDVKHRTKEGEARDVHVIIKPLALSGQTVLHAIWRDITERKRADGAMRLQSEIIGNISEGIYLVSAKDLRIIYANPRMEEMFGYAAGEMNGKHVSVVNAPAAGDPSGTAERIGEALKKTGKWHGEVLNVRKDGTTFWSHASVSALHHPQYGEVYVSLQTDITARKQAEDALQSSEERFRLAMLGATDGLWDWNLKTDEVYFSPRWKAMLGYADEELNNHIDTCKALMHPDDRDSCFAFVRGFLESRADKFEIEYRLRRKDGEYLDILSRAFLVRDSGGMPLRLVGTHVDITERKKMQEAFRRSEEFIRNILDNVDEGFLVVDRDFSILTANKAYCAWNNATSAGIIGRHCYEVSHRAARPCDERGEECAVKRVFETGQPCTAMHKHEDPNGKIMYVETKAFPLRDSSGSVTSAIETIHNITERHLLEAEQLKSQKLEAIGTLAGGIAHDFNNLLQGIFGNISMAKLSLDREEVALARLEQAEKALNMSVSLAIQLLTFSKGGSPVKKNISLKAVIENAANFALSGSRCHFDADISRDLWHVEADEGQIGQVMQNIILNANEAMPEGGAVAISAGNVEVPVGSSASLPKGGKFVKISVRDSGIGIPEHYLSRIFDPYFTTKQRGSGLGLATSYSIVRNHGGVIGAASRAGKGSTFTVFLPAATGPADEQPSPRPAARMARKGNILFMDDEDIVTQVVKAMIDILGHDVVCAANGEEAIEKFKRARDEGRPFDVVILDLTVKGGMGGEQALGRLREIDSGIKAIVSSGYSDSPVVSDYRSYGFSAFLNKPYMIEALRDSLNALLLQS